MVATTSTRKVEREQTVPPVKLAHFVLRTPNFDQTRRWYRTVLGASPVFENDFLCFMTYDDEHHRLALINTPEAAQKGENTAGVDHIAFTFANMGDLLGTFARLKADGIEPYWCINHGPTTSMYYRDPDGNQIELQIDNFETQEDLDAFFGSGAFQQNPIGVEFDPERLLERFEYGDSKEDLFAQDSA